MLKRFLPSGFLICAGVLSIAAASAAVDQTDVTKVRKKTDLRETLLRKFFKDNHCPAEKYSSIFLKEADEHGLDWRLLPSLSFVESGGGKTARNNNLFGWANGKRQFNSISEAIHHVASTLSHGKSYRGKDLEAKLFTYNHRAAYRQTILDMMTKIAPAPVDGLSE